MTPFEPDPIPEWLGRMSALETAETIETIRRSRVLCVGLGGVGGLAAELVARLGVGAMTIVDGDVVEPTNINRQIPALTSTVGQSKAIVMADRLMDIDPKLKLTVLERFLSPDDMPGVLNTGRYDCVLDAIDSVPAKIALLAECLRRGVPAVSAMGAGLRTDPGSIRCGDISETSVCPLAKLVRKGLRELGFEHGVTAVFSTETPRKPKLDEAGRPLIGTVSFMPAAFAVRCAAAVYRILAR
ncbi:MAG: tRNA threonylcarbamoyladenosine dehydratase [Lentisphaeria bacterium]|nr:tRNA threonylcarbamoyladenosine dehydratase [Lentisphaeria bacterium]